jgi:hypothetical protein
MMSMLDSMSASSCTSSVVSRAMGTSGPVATPPALRLPARRLQLAWLRGSWSPQLVLLSAQRTRHQYPGTTTTTWGKRHRRSLCTFHYDSFRRRSLRALRNGLSLRKGC